MSDAEVVQEEVDVLATTQEVEDSNPEEIKEEAKSEDNEPEAKEPVSEDSSTESSEEESEPQGKKHEGVQKRIDELTRLRRDAERERDYWKEQAEKPQEPKEIRTLADFEYDEVKYQQYLADEYSKLAESKFKELMRQENQKSAIQRRNQIFSDTEKDFSNEVKDYYQVTRSEDLQYSESMHDIVTDLDYGHEVLYYLGKNKDVAAKIHAMPEKRQAIEFGRLEERLQALKVKPVSNAPAPPKTIKGGKSQVQKAPEKMSQSEFEKYRQKVIKSRRY